MAATANAFILGSGVSAETWTFDAPDGAGEADRDPGGLVARARGGDRPAFDALHRRFAPMVHAILLSIVAPREADDLSQEVFLAAWRAIDRLRDADRVGPWLATIARNRARTARERRRALERLPESLPDRRAHDDGEEILRILRTLPEAYRETLAMRLVEGMTGPEIAAASGLTHGSVRVNLCRGMKLLREALRAEGWE